ncbi:hypothetical protein GCM10009430_16110 [Aquimarina litoralis]|uniref:SMI1/KNR4 family protein n=1 Tax=Aquimarina litoralis TaxID=584605 RepID=A0ABP3TY85_9FLAO
MNLEIIGEKINIDIDSISNVMDFEVSTSYVQFIKAYGYGVISEKIEYLNVISPDKDFFENNFINDIDLWEWKNNEQKDAIRNSMLIAHTFDGEHVYLTNHSFMILPRFNDPIELATFDEVLQYYIRAYDMKETIFYKPHQGY